MGLGSTAKKIQSLSDRAEQMYRQVQELQKRIIGLEEGVDKTSDRVTKLEHQVREQRALLVAIAEQQGLDGEEILAEAAIEEAEAPDADAPDAETNEGDAREETTDATAETGK